MGLEVQFVPKDQMKFTDSCGVCTLDFSPFLLTAERLGVQSSRAPHRPFDEWSFTSGFVPPAGSPKRAGSPSDVWGPAALPSFLPAVSSHTPVAELARVPVGSSSKPQRRVPSGCPHQEAGLESGFHCGPRRSERQGRKIWDALCVAEDEGVTGSLCLVICWGHHTKERVLKVEAALEEVTGIIY